jgi:tetratricopeptide (TPR) repeat protein
MTVELPPPVVHFVNRVDEKEQARRTVRDHRDRSRALVFVLSGPAGTGTTELANEIAREAADGAERFTDVLCVDLDDYRSGGELDVADVLGQLLGSLGVEPAFVKASFKARCRQYWAKTAGRAFVLVVDHARYASEVTPLVPASGGSVVIVTSHGPLYDLEDGAAVDLPLPPLDEVASAELLDRVVGDGRVASDPEAARAVVDLCGGFPAVLRVAGGWIRRHQLRPLSRLLAELEAELANNGVPVVEQVWDAACRDLSGNAALLYRLLSEHPGPVFSRASATALLGLGPDACDEALEELGRAGLVDLREAHRGRDARMRMPELQRAHARRKTRQDLGPGEPARAQERNLRWLTRQFQRADLFAAGPRLGVAVQVEAMAAAPDLPLEEPRQAHSDEERAERTRKAARWLYVERRTLFACVRMAHARELDALAVALCEPVWTYALDHPHQSDVVEVFRLGVECAVRAGDVRGMVRMRCQLARWLWESDRIDEAAGELGSALAGVDLLGTTEGDTKLRASAIEFRGMLSSVRGEWASAAGDFTRSRELHRSIHNGYGVMLQTYRLGQAEAELGNHEAALLLLTEAHSTAAELKRERMTSRTGFALGHVLRGTGRTEEARRLYQEALDGARRRGAAFDEARVLDAFADLADEEGRSEEAGRHRLAAAAIRQRNGLS